MPQTSISNAGIFASNFAGVSIAGINSVQLAQAFGQAVFNYSYSPTGIIVNTIDIGSFGVGVGVGTSILTPASLLPALTSAFAGQGMTGISMVPMISALANSAATIISSSIVRTNHSTVGVGTGVGSLLPSSAVPYVLSALAAFGIAGIANVKIATGFANGLDAALPTTLVNVAITGSVSPASAGGVGIGSIY